MRLRSIWTNKGYTLVDRLLLTRDSLALKAARALPLRVRYWTVVNEVGKATTKHPELEVPAQPFSLVMAALDRPKVVR